MKKLPPLSRRIQSSQLFSIFTTVYIDAGFAIVSSTFDKDASRSQCGPINHI